MHQLLLTGLLLSPVLATAGDAPGCADPAMFPERMPNFSIASCKKSQDAITLRWPGGQQALLGLVHEVVYKAPSAADGASPKYIAANYANALTGIGGKLLADPAKSTLGDRVTGHVDIDGRKVWVHVSSDSPVIGGNWQSYKLTVVQPDGGAQVISARKLLDELDSAGFIALYFQFDTGRWQLKDDALATIREIARMLRDQPALKLAIEGHTDNVGTPADNKLLSERRAKAVLDAVVSQGIDPARLSHAGYGQERPVADNRSEDGRSKNRRVELVKQ